MFSIRGIRVAIRVGVLQEFFPCRENKNFDYLIADTNSFLLKLLIEKVKKYQIVAVLFFYLVK